MLSDVSVPGGRCDSFVPETGVCEYALSVLNVGACRSAKVKSGR